jgi:hypothetical protein
MARGTAEIGTDVSYNSGFLWALGRDPSETLPEPSFKILGAHLSWTTDSGRYRYYLWGENLTDTKNGVYEISGVPQNAISYNRGREYGLGVDAKF